MARRPFILVSAALVTSLTVLVLMGQRVLERDRAALFARYAEERQHGIEEAARGVAGEVSDLGDDLDLASTLLQSAESPMVAARELHAIATIKREYIVMYARTDDGETTKVTALDAPARVTEQADSIVERQLAIAEREPGRLHVSSAYIAPAEPGAWYRVFAWRPKDHGPAVAAVVDTAVLLARMKLQRDPMTRTLIIDARGATAGVSDRALAALVRDRPDVFGPLLAAIATGTSSTGILDDSLARGIGLPTTRAVVIGVPLVVNNQAPWTLLVVSSTRGLQTQEQTIVRRVVVGSALVLALLLSAAAYVLRNMFRARALRERVQHMDHLAHLTEKAEKILDHIPSGVVALSEHRRITSVNRWLAERLGHDVVGQQLVDAFDSAPTDDVSLVVNLVERALETGQPQSLHRERVALLGREASLNIHAIPLARGIGDVSVLLVFDDLTELCRIEERLLHSEKLVTAGQLAAGIAHEVGTPLNVARGRAELSLSHLGNEHQDADNQRVVIDQIDRVTRLIRQLLDYVRPSPATMQQVDLAQALHAVKNLLAPQASKRDISLHVDVDDRTTLYADPDQVQQIIVNLMLNAFDACPRGGNVWLRAHSSSRSVTLEIGDDGHGIPREIQKQVFDPFFTTKKRGRGTGLGLWVVAQLVRSHDAEIELDSSPANGTTVRVHWPVRA
ncbi:MAG: PAS domain-containing protein [Deltaproteobacteria bacterium]|nr:PAS domain-containing protein [Deltaproteobacteria bacterium]MDQ3294986.1 ATP-binding protein [Myxococcota bacterium]